MFKVVMLAVLAAWPLWIMLALDIRLMIRERRARMVEGSRGFDIDVVAKPEKRRDVWVD